MDEQHRHEEAPAWWILGARILLIVAAVVWIYWPALSGGFIWDDTWYITLNPLLHDWGGLWKFWSEPGSWVEYFPLNETILWIEYQLWGEQTPGYHLVSLILHIAGAFLVWRLLGRLELRMAWIGGLLFAINPVQVQSVAWICELKNTCSLPLAVLAMTAWIDFEKRGRSRDYWLTLLFLILSMLGKITMAAFPFVVLLYAWWRRNRIDALDLRRAAPFLIVTLSLSALTIYASKIYQGHSHAQDVIISLGDWPTRVARAGVLWWFYLASCLFPVDMMPVYPRWSIAASSIVSWIPLLALLALGAWSWFQRATWGRHLLLGLGFFSLNLLPFLGLNGISYMVDMWVELHLLYLPMVGVVALTVAAVEDLTRKLPRTYRFLPGGAITVVVVALIFGARAYASWFTGEETFWIRTMARNPNASFPYQDLGCYMIHVKRYDEAIAYLRKGVAILPTYDFGHYNLGIALEKSGQLNEAEAEYREAIRLNPHKPEAYLDLGELQRQKDNIGGAEKTFRDGLDNAPDSATLAVNLAGILLEKGQVNDALQLYARAEKLNPDQAHLQYDYGSALLKAGELPAAVEHFANAVELDPSLAVAHQSLGGSLAQTGHLPEAITELETALALDPTLGPARLNLARALAQSGRIPEAIEQFQTALQYHPDDSVTRQNLSTLQQYELEHPSPGGAK